MRRHATQLFTSCLMAIAVLSGAGGAQTPANIRSATLAETGQKAAEVSTEQLQRILQEKSVVVFDVRPFREFALGHIPGALNVAAKPGVPISLYVSDIAEIGRVLKGDKARPIVIYCNGPFCGKSKRTAAELLEAGFTEVRRYQLGIPVWRALGGVTQIEPEGARHVLANDRTAVFIDARDAQDFKAAKDDGRLPMEDHNARIIVFGKSGEQARAVAEAIAQEAFHNVAFFDGDFEQFRSAVQP
jgi:rhodanese-related sulfurtransferase